jgi:DNA repair protein RecO (recombination protein O)
MATFETDAVVLRGIRYGEADTVLTLLTRDHGLASAMAKGARKTTSKLGGRLQPGVWVRLTLFRGRGDMHTIRGASVVQAHAGLWVEGYRLQAASSVLEAAMRTLPEGQEDEAAFTLLVRTLEHLATATPLESPARLDPLVLSAQAKLLVVAGLVPRLGSCVSCGAPPPLVAFSARMGGTLCRDCAVAGEPFSDHAREGLAALLGNPLAEARRLIDPPAALGIERVIGLLLHEHMGVELRSATPVEGSWRARSKAMGPPRR